MSAVRMPSGISIVPGARARSSTARRKPPPISADRGSTAEKFGPTSIRTMCGISRPIQPTIPLMLTHAAVITVAARMRIRRTRGTSTPRVRASSSPAASVLSGQRKA